MYNAVPPDFARLTASLLAKLSNDEKEVFNRLIAGARQIATLSERERCAKVCEDLSGHATPAECAAAIRAMEDEEGAT